MIDDHLNDADTLLQQWPLGYSRLAADDAQPLQPMALRGGMREAIDRPQRLRLKLIGQRIGGIDFLQGNLVQRVESEHEFDCQQAA